MITTDKMILGTGLVTSSGNSLYINQKPVEATFSKSVTFFNGNGISTGSYLFPVWRATGPCTLTGIHGYLTSGVSTGVINARKNKVSSHLSSNLSVNGTGTWFSAGSIQNATYAYGDALELQVITISGLPVTLTMQVDFINTT
jgi:hypothetical protein